MGWGHLIISDDEDSFIRGWWVMFWIEIEKLLFIIIELESILRHPSRDIGDASI